VDNITSNYQIKNIVITLLMFTLRKKPTNAMTQNPFCRLLFLFDVNKRNIYFNLFFLFKKMKPYIDYIFITQLIIGLTSFLFLPRNHSLIN
jgi:hypothetical protein